MAHPLTRAALGAQGGYYLITGIVPFVSRRAFEAVTGPKADWWLVQTVSVLVDAVGVALIAGAARDRVTPELVVAAGGCAAGLAAVDVVYATRGRIARTYFADAAVQAACAAALAVGVSRRG
jgi:hypothetical protein